MHGEIQGSEEYYSKHLIAYEFLILPDKIFIAK